jgi:hypothetical protein
MREQALHLAGCASCALVSIWRCSSTRPSLPTPPWPFPRSSALALACCSRGTTAMAATKPIVRRCFSPRRLPRSASQPPRGRPRPPPISPASRSRAGRTCGRAWSTAMDDANQALGPQLFHRLQPSSTRTNRAIMFLVPRRTSGAPRITSSAPVVDRRRSTGRQAACCRGQVVGVRLELRGAHQRMRVSPVLLARNHRGHCRRLHRRRSAAPSPLFGRT